MKCPEVQGVLGVVRGLRCAYSLYAKVFGYLPHRELTCLRMPSSGQKRAQDCTFRRLQSSAVPSLTHMPSLGATHTLVNSVSQHECKGKKHEQGDLCSR